LDQWEVTTLRKKNLRLFQSSTTKQGRSRSDSPHFPERPPSWNSIMTLGSSRCLFMKVTKMCTVTPSRILPPAVRRIALRRGPPSTTRLPRSLDPLHHFFPARVRSGCFDWGFSLGRGLHLSPFASNGFSFRFRRKRNVGAIPHDVAWMPHQQWTK